MLSRLEIANMLPKNCQSLDSPVDPISAELIPLQLGRPRSEASVISFPIFFLGTENVPIKPSRGMLFKLMMLYYGLPGNT